MPRSFRRAADSPDFMRWFAAYWFTMLASGVFIYCGVLGVQGLAAQLLPRRLFLRVSGLLQLAAFCLFVCGYFLQPVFGGLASLTAPEIQRAAALGAVLLVPGALPAIERIDASDTGPAGAARVDRPGDCGVRHCGGVHALLFAYATQDRGGAGYHAWVAPVRLAAAVSAAGCKPRSGNSACAHWYAAGSIA